MPDSSGVGEGIPLSPPEDLTSFQDALHRYVLAYRLRLGGLSSHLPPNHRIAPPFFASRRHASPLAAVLFLPGYGAYRYILSALLSLMAEGAPDGLMWCAFLHTSA